MNTAKVRKERMFSPAARRGFTLIELLTVVAIIGLLISILAPALSKARQQARNVVTRGALQSIGGGLEMFRNENQRDFRRTDGLPSSARAEDKALAGTQKLFGAQWLVRYLMGKDLHGYAPRRNVPRDMLDPGADDEEVEWYEYNDDGTPKVERVGPYLSSEAVRLAKPDELPGYDLLTQKGYPTDTDAESMKQPVILDAFGYPILYYVANPRQAAKPRAYVAGYDPLCETCIVGIFDFSDNGLFTGQCDESTCKYDGWDFEAVGPHHIKDFGPTSYNKYTDYVAWFEDPAAVHTFPYYIMNKTLYDSTYDSVDPDNVPTLTPYRKNSYLLIAPGKDALYGTDDDITNFE
ncbi:MAG TPA: prepilin-type N-terminal cleavage/methylation domain-containing protein [Phycisphaerae bacterium]|nr:prepilin-type N-terminal cleavage/methylation domain-containing protein [Phycisphaerae bacterium]